jgi:hypothetical protein
VGRTFEAELCAARGPCSRALPTREPAAAAAQVVGLGAESWALVMVFMVVTTWIGFMAWVFVCLAGALLLVLNAKLIAIVR